MSELGSQVGTSFAMGDNVSLGTVIGSVAGGIIGGKLPNWRGTKGGWFKNAISEIGFNAARGATRGVISGGFGAAIDGRDIVQGILNGSRNGAMGGASQSLAMIAMFGATYKPTQQQLIYANRMANAFGLSTNNVSWRKGGVYQGIMSLLNNKRDVTWGNDVATYSDTSSKTFGHEYGHIIQVSKQGWARFQATGIFEQLFMGSKSYITPGTNEYGANLYLYQYGKNQ